MAQDFTRYIARDTGTSGATLFTSDSDDAVISMRLANIHSGTITADVFVTLASESHANNYYLVKAISIPTGSSVELIDGASRFVVISGDRLQVDCNTDNALDVWVSVVDAIST
ncbi:uncharacterized protein METZ01_LOCUS244409 [marine metagenome]|uniref:Uncharacterized protein n=1 Tax=marine metagenome TaxID=408172 RepID=A0A382HWR7_9ZZZZ